MTTAAAPSPNRPLATRLGIESSARCTVSEQSSTVSSTATPSGSPREVVVHAGDAGGAGHAAQTEDRHPRTSVRSPSRGTSRASRLGAAIPVTDVHHQQVDVARLQAGRGEGVGDRLLAEIGADPDEDVVGRAEPVQGGVVLERQRQVPAADPGRLVQPSRTRRSVGSGSTTLGEGGGDRSPGRSGSRARPARPRAMRLIRTYRRARTVRPMCTTRSSHFHNG